MNLQTDFINISSWFEKNSMVLNSDKCHFMLLGSTNNTIDFRCGNTVLKVCKQAKILGITIDNKLKFSTHIDHICKTASQKLNALHRVSGVMCESKKSLLISSYVKSQFQYCPLIWMFCSKTSMKKINRIHEKSLRIIYNDYVSDYNNLLSLSNKPTIHQYCIQSLVTEIYKFLNNLSPDVMNKVFTLREIPYQLRNPNIFLTDNPRKSRFGLDTVTYRSSQIWAILPENMRQSASLSIFKTKIKEWKCENCPCRLCKNYECNIGFI